MNILILNYEYPPMGGGAGNATQQTAKELVRKGHLVHIITSRFESQPSVDKEDGVLVFRVFSRRKSIHEAGLFGVVTFLFGAFLKMRRLAQVNDYDVFHFYFGLPTGLLALYVRLVLKKPYVVALRGSDVPGYDNTRWYLRPLHGLFAPLTSLIWKHAAAVTALSESLKALAQDTAAGIPIVIVRNGIDPSAFPARPSVVREKPETRLICVSRLVRRKGLEYLLAAIRELRAQRVTLDIVGTGECEFQIRRHVERLGIDDCVQLIGYVPRENLVEYYHRSDIFVLPSLSESFGQVLLEAMASGLPIIASRVGGIPETLDHGKGGLLIEPASSVAIVRAVQSLAGDPHTCVSMGEYNRMRAVDRFDWAGVARQYESLYALHTQREHRLAARPASAAERAGTRKALQNE